MRPIIVIAPVLIMAAAPAAAQAPALSNPGILRPSLVIPLQQRPPDFRPVPQLRAMRPLAPPAAALPLANAQPRVVCGLQMIEGNAAVDPGIQARMQPSPQSSTTSFTIRAIDPPVCNPSR